jgi:hypothetical protein
LFSASILSIAPSMSSSFAFDGLTPSPSSTVEAES